jgi:molybdopterin converting factor small subunit
MIKIRFLGHLATHFNEEIKLSGKVSVAELLNKLSHNEGGLQITRSNTLILVNGVEVSALDGEQTEVKDDDVVTLVPISHGG